MARPTSYTSEIALEICSRLAGGESLRAICCDSHLPHRDTVRLWVVNDTQGFHGQYARAREAQVEHYADEIVEISDETAKDTLETEHGEKPNSEWISRSRLRVDTRKWLMSKLAPKKYGEKIDVTTDGQALNLTAEDRAAKLAAIQAAAAKRKAEQEDGEDLL
jgi:hypothetical protein